MASASRADPVHAEEVLADDRRDSTGVGASAFEDGPGGGLLPAGEQPSSTEPGRGGDRGVEIVVGVPTPTGVRPTTRCWCWPTRCVTRVSAKQSIETIRHLISTFPKSPLLDQAHYWLAEFAYDTGDMATASREYESVVRGWPKSSSGALAVRAGVDRVEPERLRGGGKDVQSAHQRLSEG